MCATLFSTLAIALACGLFVGCQNGDVSTADGGSTVTSNNQDSKTAVEILEQLRTTYSSIQQYQDKASLHLSYRIDGQLMEEHHPWNVTYSRPRKLVSKLFNARLKSDGEILSCFVYDFPSGNLDDQHMVLDAQNKLPLTQLLTDSIARHFIAGQTEIPINGSRPLAFESFIPPTLELLCGEPGLRWLQTNNVRRLDDVEIAENRCYQIALDQNQLTFKLSIDCETGLLAQVDYPVELLDERLQQSEQVSELRLFASFSEATSENTVDDSVFDLELPEGAKTVSRFVAVPEKFPCNWIGKSLMGLRIKDMGGFPIKGQQWKGRVTTLIWIDEALAAYHAEELNQLASQFSNEEFGFAIVLIGGLTNNNNIAKLVANDFNILMDDTFEIGTTIELQTTPAAVVLDREGKIQFTQNVSEGTAWQNKLSAAIKRIRGGDQIASEMRNQYELFLEQYRQRLSESNPFQKVSHVESKTKRFFEAQKAWHLGTIKLPGNIVRLYGETNNVLINEGYQSVAIVGPEGNLVSRNRIPVDNSETVSMARVNHGRHPKATFAMFSALSPQLIVLSEQFAKIAKLPGDSDNVQIVDAAWIPNQNRSNIALALHDRSEIVYGELDGGGFESIQLPQPTKSIAVIDWVSSNQQPMGENANKRFTVICCLRDGALVSVTHDKYGKTHVHPNELVEQSADWVCARSPDESSLPNTGSSRQQTSYVVIGSEATGRWMANGYSPDHARLWRIPIQAQQHETQIQPIAHCSTELLPGGIWAVAGSDGVVTIISDDGRFADTIDIGFVPRGIELIVHKGQPTLIASGSDGAGVAAWKISIPDHVAMTNGGSTMGVKRR